MTYFSILMIKLCSPSQKFTMFLNFWRLLGCLKVTFEHDVTIDLRRVPLARPLIIWWLFILSFMEDTLRKYCKEMNGNNNATSDENLELIASTYR